MDALLSSKIKLFVDDLRPCPDGWHLARTITEAIRILHNMFVSEVSLDYDIVFKRNKRLPEGSETFEPVARYIALLKHPPTIIRIHTGNQDGAVILSEILVKNKNIKEIFRVISAYQNIYKVMRVVR